jgi:ABC-2 type transport system ATP-binding protein
MLTWDIDAFPEAHEHRSADGAAHSQSARQTCGPDPWVCNIRATIQWDARKEDRMPDEVVSAVDLKKYFRTRSGNVKAVDGLDLSIPAGQVFGFLGPNGAGKTTTLRILTTLIVPDSGRAVVAGYDVLKDPGEVRRHIGYVSQAGGSDRPATGRENLVLQGRLYGMLKTNAEKRASELIDLLDLTEFADRIVYTYSGGQRRRLDVALGIMHGPQVLFLDEPTTGLDPQNRANLWEQIAKLKATGTTIFLTTHYLEEADILSDYVAIMDHGQIVAQGTPDELKRQVSLDTIRITLSNPAQNPVVRGVLERQEIVKGVADEGDSLRISVDNGEAALPRIMRALDNDNISIAGISLSTATLDDVFLEKTGRSLRDTAAEGGAR